MGKGPIGSFSINGRLICRRQSTMGSTSSGYNGLRIVNFFFFFEKTVI